MTAATGGGNPWLAQGRATPTPPGLRLICFPYAGGAASVYRGWDQALGPEVEVCAVRLPGRGARLREPAFTRLADLVTAAAQGLANELRRPYALFGHSMGGLVCLEVAHELRRRGAPAPAHVTLSGCRPPHRPEPDPPIGHLPDDEFISQVRDRYQGIPKEVLAEPELLELLLPVIRADFVALETHSYTESPPLDCPLLVLGGEGDPRLDLEDLEDWRRYTRGEFTVRTFPGDHFFLESARDELLQMLASELQQRSGATTSPSASAVRVDGERR